MVQALTSGDWLTRERVRVFALVMAALTLALPLILILGGHGTVDGWGRPVGTDFSNVWTAGWMADHGRAAAAWRWPEHYAVQRALHGTNTPFYGWHYPPPFLLVAALLAWLPYLPAYLAWQAATLAGAVAVTRRIVADRETGLVPLGFPAVFVCVGHGQNGFLTAALLGSGLLLLERRPVLAGMLLGCLCYKPQFAPVLPVLLVAGRHWRAMVAVGLTVAALVALTTAIWGPGVWFAFADSLALTRSVVIEAAATGAHKIVSAFAAARMNGGSVALAYAVQGLASGLAVLSVVAVRRARPFSRNAVAAAAALLATPYAFDYDLVVLGVAIAFLIAEARETGWLGWEKSALALAYLTPLIGRGVAQASGVPLGLGAIVLVWALAMRRCYTIAMPPLTCSVWPVTYPASRLAR